MLEEELYNFRKELENLGYSKGAIDNYPRYAKRLLEHTKEISSKITVKHIQEYHSYLKQKIHYRKVKTLSESYIHSQLFAIRLFFEYLERTRKIKKNPYNLKIRSPIKTPREILTQDQIKILYKNCQTLEETAILHLCYGCGLRRSEAQNLEIKDIHFEQKIVFIRKGKGKKRRVIPITETIAEDLRKYCSISQNYRTEQQNFLINNQGNAISGGTIYRIFNRILRNSSLELEAICLHSLRHSIATHLLENEMSIEMVRNFLGHQSLKTTQIYTRINLLKLKK
jgi:integrase/recombinase XerD